MDKNIKLELKKIEFRKTRFNTYFGNIGEMIAEEILIKEGYSVWEMRPYSCPSLPSESKIAKHLTFYLDYLYKEKPQKDKLRTEYEARYTNLDPKIFSVPSWHDYYRDIVTNYLKVVKDLKNFFGEKLEGVKAYFESLGIIGETGVTEDIQATRKSERIYTPDLVAKKDGEIYIVEVKTNSGNSYLKGEKLNGLLSARKFALVPLLINLKVTLDATNFVMEEL